MEGEEIFNDELPNSKEAGHTAIYRKKGQT